MGTPDLFIAVVTHPKSVFPESRGPSGAAARISRALESRGLEVELVVEDRNLWTEVAESGSSGLGTSYRAELAEEWRWRGFLGNRGVFWMARQGLRLGASVVRPARGPEAGDGDRLLNIEMAHRSLWKQGLESGAEVVLVIEDDADLEDAEDFAAGLTDLLNVSWSFVNLSLSFDRDALGVTNLLKGSGVSWAGADERSVLRPLRPVTNTVCAMAYRREFVVSLLAHWEAMPMEPVLPIDWKMNRALREMVQDGDLAPDSSLWIEPGPLVQRSLHPNTRS